MTESEHDALMSQARADGVQRFVVGAVVGRNRQALLIRRRADDFMGGMFELPGGKVEAGETLLAALHRELAEEIGCAPRTIVKACTSFDYRSKSGALTRQFNFVVTIDAACTIRLSSDHDAHVWVAAHELTGLRVSDDVKGALMTFWEDVSAKEP